MGSNPKGRERKKQKRAAKAKGRTARQNEGQRESVLKAARWPVSGAWVSQGWREAGQAGTLLVREHPEDGRAMAAMVLIDLWGMGVKDTHFDLVEDLQTLRDQAENSRYEPCAPELVAAIVQAGQALGEQTGLPQAPGLPLALEMLRGLDASQAGPIVTGARAVPRAPGLLSLAAHEDDALDEALHRCGQLKEALVAFARSRGVERREHDVPSLAVQFFDLAVLTKIDAFLEETEGLDEVEQALLRSWSKPVVGAFCVLERDADSLQLESYVDGRRYLARTNLGLGAVADMPPFEFLLTNLVPGPRDWLLSGEATMLADEEAARTLATRIASSMPNQTHP